MEFPTLALKGCLVLPPPHPGSGSVLMSGREAAAEGPVRPLLGGGHLAHLSSPLCTLLPWSVILPTVLWALVLPFPPMLLTLWTPYPVSQPLPPFCTLQFP